jgi:hypothetical protein
VAITLTDQQDLVLAAARAPRRTLPEHHLLSRTALTLLTASASRERTYLTEALAAGLCPFCLWPFESCPDCASGEPYCCECDVHITP